MTVHVIYMPKSEFECGDQLQPLPTAVPAHVYSRSAMHMGQRQAIELFHLSLQY